MGTWGAENFANDTSMDMLGDFADKIISEITEAFESPDCLEPDELEGEWVPCQLEILTLLAETYFAPLPPAETLRSWKATFLQVWEDTIDGLEPSEDYRRERRGVLEATFDKAIEVASRD